MSKLEEHFINYVRNAVDIAVANTGYPITGQVLTTSGIARRDQLRILERRGALNSVKIQVTDGPFKGQILKAYYTERAIPEALVKEQDEPSK